MLGLGLGARALDHVVQIERPVARQHHDRAIAARDELADRRADARVDEPRREGERERQVERARREVERGQHHAAAVRSPLAGRGACASNQSTPVGRCSPWNSSGPIGTYASGAPRRSSAGADARTSLTPRRLEELERDPSWIAGTTRAPSSARVDVDRPCTIGGASSLALPPCASSTAGKGGRCRGSRRLEIRASMRYSRSSRHPVRKVEIAPRSTPGSRRAGRGTAGRVRLASAPEPGSGGAPRSEQPRGGHARLGGGRPDSFGMTSATTPGWPLAARRPTRVPDRRVSSRPRPRPPSRHTSTAPRRRRSRSATSTCLTSSRSWCSCARASSGRRRPNGAKLVECDSNLDAQKAINCAAQLKIAGREGHPELPARREGRAARLRRGPKVPVVAIDIHQPPCETVFYGANNFQAGKLAAPRSARTRRRRGTARSTACSRSTRRRRARSSSTARTASSPASAVAVPGPQGDQGHDERDDGRRRSSRSPTRSRGCPGKHQLLVVATNDDQAIGAIKAAQAAGRLGDIYIGAQGGDPTSWPYLCGKTPFKNWIADTAYFPEDYGDTVVPPLLSMIDGQKEPKYRLHQPPGGHAREHQGHLPERLQVAARASASRYEHAPARARRQEVVRRRRGPPRSRPRRRLRLDPRPARRERRGQVDARAASSPATTRRTPARSRSAARRYDHLTPITRAPPACG